MHDYVGQDLPSRKLLSDRIERNIEDVLCEVVPPRAQTAPPRPTGGLFEDLFDAGNDVRLDVAYPDFYREQAIGNAQLPSPLDTQTLFSNLARQLIDDHSRVKSRPDIKGQGVQQLVQLVQDIQGSRTKQAVQHESGSLPNSLAMHSLADGLSQMHLHSERHASASRQNAQQQSAVPQYIPGPTPYRAQLSPTPPPRPDSRCNNRELSTSDPLYQTSEASHSAVDVPAAFDPPLSMAPSPSMPSLSLSSQAYPSLSHISDSHMPESTSGPTLPIHTNVTGRPSMAGMGYPGVAPQQTVHNNSGPMAPQMGGPGGHTLNNPGPVQPAFQNAFNAAFYAACLANQGGPGVPPPPGAMDVGHLMSIRNDHNMQYNMQAGGDPTLPTDAMGPHGQRDMPPFMMHASSAPVGGSHMIHQQYFERAGLSPGKLGGLRPSNLADSNSMPFLGDVGGRGGRGRENRKIQRRDSVRARDPRMGFEVVSPMELSIPELSGRILQMSKEQHGCRYLQRLLASAGPKEVQALLDEILPHTGELMVDPFGNYLVQKVLDVCTPAQRRAVLECACEAGLPEIACNTHGTRAAQKLVESIETPEEAALFIEQLKPQALRLILDGNSNHVIQRCLQKFDSCHTEVILNTVAQHGYDVARHRHGCCVLQRCMDYATPQCKRDLVMRVSEHGLDLSQNAFGNYVIQYILDTGVVEACERILSQLRGRFAMLSCQKFASNVVEKALKHSTVGMEHWRDIIVVELIEAADHSELLKDQFGNYVLQSALRVTSGDLHARLVQAIKPHMACLKTLQHGKRIMQQLQGAV